ncbi:MAG: peptidylprolyl isomerase [Polyangiaceae bacterium]|nr:peptidylprolyl isomerase [Polyangiaceae bacterium]
MTHLTPSEAAGVLATVGGVDITLGQYATALSNMGEFERLRYQSPERQKALLDELIEAELLAQEARRRELDKTPEYRLKLIQAVRDKALLELKNSLPGPESFTEAEVEDWYEAHLDEYREPERRRVSLLIFPTEKSAAKALAEIKADPQKAWSAYAKKYSSLGVEDPDAHHGAELAGDQGFTSAEGVERGSNEQVPPAVRQGLFQLKKQGEIAPAPVKLNKGWGVYRWTGTSAARTRSRADSERAIRAALARKQFREAEGQLEKELREAHPVVINQQMIDALKASSESEHQK